MAARRGSCMEQVAGWEGRAATKATAGGLMGSLAGLVVCALRPSLSTPLSAAVYTGAGSALALGAFSCIQEGFRALTCQDSPLNSIFAGGLTGFTLGLAHHGRGRGPALASACFAAAGGTCHLLDDQGLSVPAITKAALQSMDLLEVPEADGPAATQEQPAWFQRWLPIRKLNDEEYANAKWQQDLRDTYGTGQIDHEDYVAQLKEAQIQAAMMKQRRMFESDES